MENQNIATLEGLLKENSKTLQDCLAISNVILAGLTANECNMAEVASPDCMMSEVIAQSDDLKKLKEILLDIKTTMLNA